MLYFQIKSDSNKDDDPRFCEIPNNFLIIQKEMNLGGEIYQYDKGRLALYFKFSNHTNWMDEIKATNDAGKARFTYYNEHVILQKGLFYHAKDSFSEEFLTNRFADPLNIIYGSLSIFTPFDTGAIWSALVALQTYLAKRESTKVVTPNDLKRLSRFIGSLITNLDHATGFHTTLVKSCKKQADLYPDSIKNAREFCSIKAYLMLAYLFLLPVKEFLADRVIPEGVDIVGFLADCINGITLHTYESSYDLIFNSPDTDVVDQVVHGEFSHESTKEEPAEPEKETHHSLNDLLKNAKTSPITAMLSNTDKIRDYAEERSKQISDR